MTEMNSSPYSSPDSDSLLRAYSDSLELFTSAGGSKQVRGLRTREARRGGDIVALVPLSHTLRVEFQLNESYPWYAEMAAKVMRAAAEMDGAGGPHASRLFATSNDIPGEKSALLRSYIAELLGSVVIDPSLPDKLADTAQHGPSFQQSLGLVAGDEAVCKLRKHAAMINDLARKIVRREGFSKNALHVKDVLQTCLRRAFIGPDGAVCLIPVLDYANHPPRPDMTNVRVEFLDRKSLRTLQGERSMRAHG